MFPAYVRPEIASIFSRIGPEEVGVEVVVDALEDRGQALEARARVHRGLRQRRHLSRRVALELHEDEVPDLERLVARPVDEIGVFSERFAPRK